jgi:hypothetical protein
VIFPYLVDHARVPQVSLGGGVERPRPIAGIRLFGPGGGNYAMDGHFDTAADDTIFPLWISAMIGVDLSQAPEQDVTLVGRPGPVRARFAHVELRLTDGRQTCQWPALVGFVPLALRRALLGYAGSLQFFDGEFRGNDRQAIIIPNRAYSGRRW